MSFYIRPGAREGTVFMTLTVSGLSCGYGKKMILEGIDLKVNRGDLLVILGPNGSGKTTLIRALTRSLPPSQGEIFFEGKNLWSIPPKHFAKRCAVVSQNVSAIPMTVEEFVLLGRIPHYKDLQFLETASDLVVADRAMQEAGVDLLRDRLMTEISGGERQLAAIARALAQEPEWLFLDEPTAHLDIAHQIAVLGLLARLNREKRLTVIAVLHDLNLAAEYSHKILLMNHGCIHKMGTPEEVLDRETVESVYATRVSVGKNPVSMKPFVLPLADHTGQREV